MTHSAPDGLPARVSGASLRPGPDSRQQDDGYCGRDPCPGLPSPALPAVGSVATHRAGGFGRLK